MREMTEHEQWAYESWRWDDEFQPMPSEAHQITPMLRPLLTRGAADWVEQTALPLTGQEV